MVNSDFSIVAMMTGEDSLNDPGKWSFGTRLDIGRNSLPRLGHLIQHSPVFAAESHAC
jgi:hypothetical protein